MFTGIIKNTGTLKKIYRNKKNCTIEIASKLKLRKKDVGSSISCSGVCLTLENSKRSIMKFYVSKETLKKTNFKFLKKGELVNLEKSLKYGDHISGHFVQGHIDTTASVKIIKEIGKSWIIDFKLPKKFKRYIIYKGSVAINGVSLTIAKTLDTGFQISIIPKTLSLTNLTKLKKNDLVNVEFDILGKYIKKFMK